MPRPVHTVKGPIQLLSSRVLFILDKVSDKLSPVKHYSLLDLDKARPQAATQKHTGDRELMFKYKMLADTTVADEM